MGRPRKSTDTLYQIRQFNDAIMASNLFIDEQTKLQPNQLIALSDEEAAPFLKARRCLIEAYHGDTDDRVIIERGNWAIDPSILMAGHEAHLAAAIDQSKAKDAEIAELKSQLAAVSNG